MANRTLKIYCDQNGKEPFTEWYRALKDLKTQARVRNRLRRVEAGNLGDWKAVGKGVIELKIDFGPGYRVYLGEIGNTLILLLCGGDKRRQNADIKRAQAYLAEYKESQT